MAATDEELVARALAADDRRAFAEMVRRHQSAVRTLLRRLCRGDAALADDLAQETFVKAWRGLAGFRGGARLSTWLHRIAWNPNRQPEVRARAPARAGDGTRSAQPVARRPLSLPLWG